MDVGGAQGHTIQSAYPAVKGKIVLGDLQSVLDDGILPNLEADVAPYDFFKEQQPVKGASAYLY